MIQRHSFIPVFSMILGGLAWWSSQVQPQRALSSVEVASTSKPDQTLNRRDLVESLDRLVVYEHYYHSVYGRYTKLINRTGYTLPRVLTENYDVRIAEATTDHLLVSAFSEVNGKIFDLISIDQNYQAHANFQIPEPRPEYLKEQAIKHLRLINDLPAGQSVSEETVFKGYFQYSFKINSKNEKIAMALGLRSPVKGIQLESDDKNVSDENPESLVFSDLLKDPSDSYVPTQTGQFPEDSESHLEQETLLAQKIFIGEKGRYAKSWSELSRIVHFRFEGKEHYANEGSAPLQPGQSTVPISMNLLQKRDEVKPQLNRTLSSHSSRKKLEIEPINDSN